MWTAITSSGESVPAVLADLAHSLASVQHTRDVLCVDAHSRCGKLILVQLLLGNRGFGSHLLNEAETWLMNRRGAAQ